MKNRMHRVYHIRPIGETDTSKFYIGITKRSLAHRLSQHMTSTRPVGKALRELGRDAVEIVELHFVSSREEALRLEEAYRPTRYIGWNASAGGNAATVRCSGCGIHLPKRRTGAMCEKCNDRKFTKGSIPHNHGKGMKAVLKSPDGRLVEFDVMADFCAKNDLIAANVRKVIKGERKHTKGWTLER